MKKLSIIFAAVFVSLSALGVNPRPRLVVGIVVEGLSTDYLDLLNSQFVDGGFNYLRTNGLSVEDLDYGSNIDATAATALALTGAAPSVNGIGGRMRYDVEKKSAFPTFHEPSILGNFTNETYSPAVLKVSNIADELRIDSRGQGTVMSVALQPETALLLSGHAGNGAFWINDAEGNWASTTFYNEMPASVSNRNYRTPLKARLDTMTWRPLFAPTLLPGLSEQKRIQQFKHNFQKGDPDRYAQFKASALGNSEVTDMAVELIKTLHLGSHQATDMINVGYSLAPYSYGHSLDSSIETLDSYIRLDRDISRLLKAARAAATGNDIVVFLIGTPAAAHDKRDAEMWKIPYGEFSVKKALSLTNMYLMALYGNGNWVTDYYDGHFYLNAELAKSRQIEMHTLRAQTAEFLSRMSGVAEAWTIDDVIGLKLGENAAAIKRNTLLEASGDVIIDIAPGWQITDDDNRAPKVVQRKARAVIPAFVVAPGMTPTVITAPVDARRLAPTISRYMWLRSPNGASMPAIR